MELSKQESRSSAGNNQEAEQAGQAAQQPIIKKLEGRNRAAQQAIIMELSRQESHSSAGNDQGAEQARISQLSWQKSRS